MLFHAALAKALRAHGVSTMFGQIGDANLYMVHDFVHREAGRYVAAAHESGAVLMSLGYARRSRRLGVATTTQGPGLSNTLTALLEGARSATPMLLITGDVTAHANLQDIDQRAVVAAAGAGFQPVESPQDVFRALATAVRRALTERRPIVLDVPTPFMVEDVEYQEISAEAAFDQATAPDPEALDRALGVLASVRRPVVLLGRGVEADARPAVLRLAALLGAPVATTLAAKGRLEGESFSLGVCGTFSNEIAAEAILDADCILAFGASLNAFTTSHGAFMHGKALVHCDADPAAIGRWVVPTVGVVGDAGAVADAMIEMVEAAELGPTNFRSPELRQRIAAFESTGAAYVDQSTATTIDLTTTLRWLNTVVPDRTVVVDGGRCSGEQFRVIDVPEPGALVYTLALGSIGLGMGAAIGAAVASPDRPVLFLVGDGSFMGGGLQEIHTAIRERLDLIVVICNDGAYGAEHVHYLNRALDPSLSMFVWPEFAAVAEAMGARGVTVRGLDDLDAATRAIAERDGPLVIDLKLDPERVPALL